ncbi:MAG: hypothetical protein H0V67_05065 [Geodermatophilaceae bacterium]|nr:hypothetical protein [Geodermatophilaceae bacterium]
MMERALPLLSPYTPPGRREISVRTAFRGPGARDAIQMVTLAVLEDRYVVDDALARPERGRTLKRYVSVLSHRDRSVTLTIRTGIVRDDFTQPWTLRRGRVALTTGGV